jgi:hypothetical protein
MKKEDFSQCFLNSLSPKCSDWQFIPYVGAAGGILLSINSVNCQLIN